jgi:hypothetical protein
MQRQEFDSLSPYDNFLNALKAKETKRQYPHRLDKFLSFLGIEGTIQQKCYKLYEIGKDVNLFQSRLINFINIQKDRIASNEISEGTLCNYIKAIKLFCSMNDIIVNWKEILLKFFAYLPVNNTHFSETVLSKFPSYNRCITNILYE